MAHHWSEVVARKHLERQGYALVSENYSVRGGEVDLIVKDGDTLVFVEVKQRRSSRYGSAGEAITEAKIKRLRRAALLYLSRAYGHDDVPLRFDAVLVSGTETRHEITHLQGAF